MVRILRLFPAFTDLENRSAMFQRNMEELDAANARSTGLEADVASARQEIAELLAEKRILEDRLANALNDRDRVWEAMQEALANERYAMHTQINHLVQKSGGGIPYQDAHRLPENAVAKPQAPGPVGRAGRVLPSQAALQQSLDNMRRIYRPAGEMETG